MTTLPSNAFEYAEEGYQAFPLKPRSKDPATRRGFYDATSNLATLRRYFGGFHPYNIGIRTGIPSGIFITDVDGPKGAESLAQLEAEHGPLPTTRVSTTGKGKHFWFIARTEIPCSISKVAPGIDIKADGGYIVAPPSIHPNGSTYSWENDAPLVDAPEWLVKLAIQKPTKAAPVVPVSDIFVPPTSSVFGFQRGFGGCRDNYCRTALEREVDAVATAAAGTRNHSLNRASFNLHQLVAVGKLDAGEVVERLYQAAHACGLLQEDGAHQVMATIQSGARAGLQCPRRLP
jgi:bifunctional DNA primase/polymerase-like protein